MSSMIRSIARGVGDKARLLGYSLRSGDYGGSKGVFLKNICLPASLPIGKRFVEKIEPKGELVLVYFKGDAMPLAFPAALDLSSLLGVLPEQFFTWHWHYYEAPETRIEPADNVLDLGAAEGLFAFRVHRRARRVVCVEPLPAFAEGLKLTFRDSPNVQIMPVAVGERRGTVGFISDGVNSRLTTEPTLETMQVETIDSLCDQLKLEVSYLKADLEGNEIQALKGAEHILARLKPRIAFTTYHNRHDAEEITKILKRCNPQYRIRCKGLAGSGYPFMLHAW